MNYLFVSLIYLCINLCININLNNCLHLTNQQINQIVNLLQENSLDLEQREKVNYILYKSYEKMAAKKALDFKNKHYFKCKNIQKQDLILSSKFGLFKSIRNYNGHSHFMYFSDLYIKHELLNVVTQYYSFSTIPKQIRMKSKQNFSRNDLLDYKNKLELTLISEDNMYILDDIHNEKRLNKIKTQETIEEIWEKIDRLDPFSKRVMYLKYDETFTKLRSNQIIGELMCCSEEYIRTNLLKTIKNLCNKTT
jgi:hypothetical protein